MSDSYIFPFDTCEKVRDNIIAQPWSVLFNILSCIILLYFILKTKKFYTLLFFFSLLLFEIIHTISHIKHIKGSYLNSITHFAAIFVNISLIIFFINYTKQIPNKFTLFILLLLQTTDLYMFFNSQSFVYLVVSQILIMFVVFYNYYGYLPKNVRHNINILLIIAVVLYSFLLNEKVNCKKMLNKYPNIPFHVIIESLGSVIFYIIGITFYKL